MIIDGKQIAQYILDELPHDSGKRIAFISFAHDPRSRAFMNVKISVAKELGIEAVILEKDVPTTEAAIVFVETVSKSYDGIVIQLPLPTRLDAQKIIDAVPTEKDIDVLSGESVAHFKQGEIKRVPPVAGAVWEVLQQATQFGGSASKLGNKKVVILGKGKLVGEPVAALFDRENISYKTFDRSTDTETLAQALQSADVVIAGIGKCEFVKPDMIKEGIILIDCGTSESAGKLSGDIDPTCALKASLYTPVPGGIGPITVACLYRNLFEK